LETRFQIKRHEKLSTILILLFFMCDVSVTLWAHNLAGFFAYASFVLATMAAGVSMVNASQRKINVKKEACVYCIALLSYVLSFLYNGNILFTDVLWYFKYLFIASALLRTTLWLFPVKIVFWGLVSYFGFIILKATDINVITNQVSYNIISVYLFVFISLYYISAVSQKKEVSYLPLIAVAVICFWTGSRSSIIASIVLALGTILFPQNGEKVLNKKRIQRMLIGGLFLIAIYYYFTTHGLMEYILQQYNTKAELELLKDTRFVIIQSYLDSCRQSPLSFIFGAKLTSIPTIKMFMTNPHNMYIRMHANFGLFFCVMIFFLSINALFFYLRKKSLYFFALLVLLLRGFSDIVGFSGNFDPLIYYFILGPLCYKRGMEKQRELEYFRWRKDIEKVY